VLVVSGARLRNKVYIEVNELNQSELREKARHLCCLPVVSAGKIHEKNHVVVI